MDIHKTRIISLENYTAAIPPGSSFRVAVAIGSADQLERAGFGHNPAFGDSILPSIRGPISRYNAEGRFVVHRDRPKEERYIRTVSWRWTQWDGEEHEDYRDIYRPCYPREHLPPPSIELTYDEAGGHRTLMSPVLQNIPENAESIKHIINLFLELFRQCALMTTDLARSASVATRSANWRMLPPGDYPWERLRPYIDTSIGRMSENAKGVIWNRLETLRSFGPAQIYVGAGGFSDYLAYTFPDKGIVVLESIRRDNAIYAFGRDWREVSQLSKAEILSQHHHLSRIIHSKGWREQLGRLLRPRAA